MGAGYAQGNMVSNCRERFTWNAENQLVQVVFPDGEGVRYEYDARGRLVAMYDEHGQVREGQGPG